MNIAGSLHWIYFIVSPWVFIFLLRGSMLIEYASLNINLLIFIGLFLLATCTLFTIGAIAKRKTRTTSAHNRFTTSRSDTFLIASLSVAYIVFLAFDFFITKGGSLATITEIREEDNLAGGRMSIFGGVIALISAAPYILLGLVLYTKYIGVRTRFRPLMFIAMIGVAASFLTGGRNSFLIGITVIFVQYLLMKNKRTNIQQSGKGNFALYAFITAFILFSLYLFAEREMNQGIESAAILDIFSIKWGVGIATLETGNDFINIIYTVLVILVFYFTHALTYLDQYFIFNASPLFLGAYNFPIPAKAIEVLVNIQVFSGLQDGLLLPGVYLTLPGSLYLDFGFWGALFFGSFLAAITGILYAGRKALSFRAMQTLCFFIAMWILSPLYSVFSVANGFSFIAILFIMHIKNISFRLNKI